MANQSGQNVVAIQIKAEVDAANRGIKQLEKTFDGVSSKLDDMNKSAKSTASSLASLGAVSSKMDAIVNRLDRITNAIEAANKGFQGMATNIDKVIDKTSKLDSAMRPSAGGGGLFNRMAQGSNYYSRLDLSKGLTGFSNGGALGAMAGMANVGAMAGGAYLGMGLRRLSAAYGTGSSLEALQIKTAGLLDPGMFQNYGVQNNYSDMVNFGGENISTDDALKKLHRSYTDFEKTRLGYVSATGGKPSTSQVLGMMVSEDVEGVDIGSQVQHMSAAAQAGSTDSYRALRNAMAAGTEMGVKKARMPEFLSGIQGLMGSFAAATLDTGATDNIAAQVAALGNIVGGTYKQPGMAAGMVAGLHHAVQNPQGAYKAFYMQAVGLGRTKGPIEAEEQLRQGLAHPDNLPAIVDHVRKMSGGNDKAMRMFSMDIADQSGLSPQAIMHILKLPGDELRKTMSEISAATARAVGTPSEQVAKARREGIVDVEAQRARALEKTSDNSQSLVDLMELLITIESHAAESAAALVTMTEPMFKALASLHSWGGDIGTAFGRAQNKLSADAKDDKSFLETVMSGGPNDYLRGLVLETVRQYQQVKDTSEEVRQASLPANATVAPGVNIVGMSPAVENILKPPKPWSNLPPLQLEPLKPNNEPRVKPAGR